MSSLAARGGSNRRPLVHGSGNLLLVVVVLALVVTLALRASQASPPAVAEFAPQAQEIKNPPPGQNSLFGSGRGGGIGGLLPTPSPSASAAVSRLLPSPSAPVIAGRVRQCIQDVGSAPRQIEDPQSPPCVPYFSGDNGGATSMGVTRDTINIATNNAGPISQALAAFINKRFEFYGRKVVLSQFNPPTTCHGSNDCTPQQQQEEADLVYNGNAAGKMFADMGYESVAQNDVSIFYDRVAFHKIIAIQANRENLPQSFESHYTALAPYQWNYQPAVDTVMRNYAEFICNELNNKPPIHASGDLRVAAKRKFGIIRQAHADGTAPLDISPLEAGTARCGVTFPDSVKKDLPEVDSSGNTTAAMVDLHRQGVTSVLFFGNVTMTALAYPAADKQQYYPEWLVNNFVSNDTDVAMETQTSPQEYRNEIGLRSWNKANPRQQMPWYWAVTETDPAAAAQQDNHWPYYNFLLLASGLQMAGPHLTPQTFQEGLFKAQFPNPGAGGPPYYQARVGFGPGRHSMVQDFAPVWPNQSQASNEWDNGVGAWCYSNHGERFSLGNWPVGPEPNQNYLSSVCY